LIIQIIITTKTTPKIQNKQVRVVDIPHFRLELEGGGG